MPRETPNPTFAWYLAQRTEAGLPPRCPFADADLCPRYYDSVQHIAEVGVTTALTETDKSRLDAKWARPSGLIGEELPTTLSSERGWHSVAHICPEVGYETFGYFATGFFRYADELDSDMAHQRLGRENAPSDHYAWTWSMVSPLHYTECRMYSVLSGIHSRGADWASLVGPPARDGANFGSTPIDVNEPFTAEEQTRVDHSVDRFIQEVELKRLLSPQDLEALKQEAPNQKKLARILGRIDWVNQFVGAVVRHVVARVVTKENMNAAWQLAMKAVEWITAHLPQLPAP